MLKRVTNKTVLHQHSVNIKEKTPGNARRFIIKRLSDLY